jgi:hypothetical protein
MSGALGGAKKSAVPIVTRCAPPKTYCHDNFGYCARKPLIRYGVFRARRGPRFALRFAVTYALGHCGGTYSQRGERLSW